MAPRHRCRTGRTDNRVYETSSALPAPVIPDANQRRRCALPNDPIEPYLLTRDAGPFMVMAKTFRGPDAERWALALVLELQNEYHLPAYILRTRDFPMRSNIRDVPPTAIRQIRKPYARRAREVAHPRRGGGPGRQ